MLTKPAVEFGDPLPDYIPIVRVFVIRMRRRDDMRNSIGEGKSAHLQCSVPGFGAIIEVWQQVVMNIDHGLCSAPLRTGFSGLL